MSENFLTIPEYAKRIGISRIAVFKQVKKGKIKAFRIGRNWIIPIDKYQVYKQDINKKELSTGNIEEISKDIHRKEEIVDKNVNNSKPSLDINSDENMENMGWD